MPEGWEWDETLYLGSAAFYERGRLPYAAAMGDVLAARLGWDGTGRLLDVGCGPGIVGMHLAGWFAEIVGVDADAGMIAEAARRTAELGMTNTRWVTARAETLPLGLGMFQAATFGQSFHWMDRPRVAAIVREMLEPGGAFIQIADVKEPPAPIVDPSDPAPPYTAMQELIDRYLGPVRRAGQGHLRHGTPGDEDAVVRAAGFGPLERERAPGGEPLIRTIDDLVAFVYSLSGSAPHLFGERRAAFERDLRALLAAASPLGTFMERAPDTEMKIWRRS